MSSESARDVASAGTGTSSGRKTPGVLSSDDPPDVETVRVVARVRPVAKAEGRGGNSQCVFAGDDGRTMRIENVEGSAAQAFKCSAAYGPDTTQEQLFRQCGVIALLERAVRGYAATLFAYGQTGAGKTHTVIGDEEAFTGAKTARAAAAESPKDGILPRSARWMYEAMAATPGRKFAVRVSCVEIYNEQVFDLLGGGSVTGGKSGAPMNVRYAPKLGFFVEDLTHVGCSDAKAMLSTVATALKARRTASHKLNLRSSRGHVITTVHIDSLPDGSGSADGGVSTYGRMSFVDLAGSERLDETESAGQTRVETGQINKSLFTLGKVIAALARSSTTTGVGGGGGGGSGSGAPLAGGGTGSRNPSRKGRARDSAAAAKRSAYKAAVEEQQRAWLEVTYGVQGAYAPVGDGAFGANTFGSSGGGGSSGGASAYSGGPLKTPKNSRARGRSGSGHGSRGASPFGSSRKDMSRATSRGGGGGGGGGGGAVVAYRDSKLTMLLRDSLGGRGVALMIACCSPTRASAGESLRTLQFAMGVKRVRNRAIVILDPQEKLIAQLRSEIAKLRLENEQLREAGAAVSTPMDIGLYGSMTPVTDDAGNIVAMVADTAHSEAVADAIMSRPISKRDSARGGVAEVDAIAEHSTETNSAVDQGGVSEDMLFGDAKGGDMSAVYAKIGMEPAGGSKSGKPPKPGKAKASKAGKGSGDDAGFSSWDSGGGDDDDDDGAQAMAAMSAENGAGTGGDDDGDSYADESDFEPESGARTPTTQQAAEAADAKGDEAVTPGHSNDRTKSGASASGVSGTSQGFDPEIGPDQLVPSPIDEPVQEPGPIKEAGEEGEDAGSPTGANLAFVAGLSGTGSLRGSLSGSWNMGMIKTPRNPKKKADEASVRSKGSGKSSPTRSTKKSPRKAGHDPKKNSVESPSGGPKRGRNAQRRRDERSESPRDEARPEVSGMSPGPSPLARAWSPSVLDGSGGGGAASDAATAPDGVSPAKSSKRKKGKSPPPPQQYLPSRYIATPPLEELAQYDAPQVDLRFGSHVLRLPSVRDYQAEQVRRATSIAYMQAAGYVQLEVGTMQSALGKHTKGKPKAEPAFKVRTWNEGEDAPGADVAAEQNQLEGVAPVHADAARSRGSAGAIFPALQGASPGMSGATTPSGPTPVYEGHQDGYYEYRSAHAAGFQASPGATSGAPSGAARSGGGGGGDRGSARGGGGGGRRVKNPAKRFGKWGGSSFRMNKREADALYRQQARVAVALATDSRAGEFAF